MNKFENLKQTLKLEYNPIGIKLIYNFNKNLSNKLKFKEVSKSRRFCEYIKMASQGEFLKVQNGNFSCHKKKGILGFNEPDNIELTMRLEAKGLEYILLFPINKLQVEEYDSIILILNPHNCMYIVEAYVRLYQKPLKATCGIIDGVCSEVTAYVIKRNEVNFSFLCPNSRLNGIFSDCELLCGIPVKMIDELIEEIIQITS
ncbi:MAG: DUF169 domain-containing protein [Candidatus Hodarchaeota archaeon]